MAESVGFEPTWVAPNGFQDRLVMTASITLRIVILTLNIILYPTPIVKAFSKIAQETHTASDAFSFQKIREAVRCVAVGNLDADAFDVQVPRAVVAVFRQRTAEGVVRMCRHQIAAFVRTRDQQGMIIRTVFLTGRSRSRPCELDDVSRKESAGSCFDGVRTDAAVRRHEIIEVLHARPRRRSVVRRTVKPARNGGIVHRLAPREQALRGEIRTIAAD